MFLLGLVEAAQTFAFVRGACTWNFILRNHPDQHALMKMARRR